MERPSGPETEEKRKEERVKGREQGPGENLVYTWIKKIDCFALLLAISEIKLILTYC